MITYVYVCMYINSEFVYVKINMITCVHICIYVKMNMYVRNKFTYICKKWIWSLFVAITLFFQTNAGGPTSCQAPPRGLHPSEETDREPFTHSTGHDKVPFPVPGTALGAKDTTVYTIKKWLVLVKNIPCENAHSKRAQRVCQQGGYRTPAGGGDIWAETWRKGASFSSSASVCLQWLRGLILASSFQSRSLPSTED